MLLRKSILSSVLSDLSSDVDKVKYIYTATIGNKISTPTYNIGSMCDGDNSTFFSVITDYEVKKSPQGISAVSDAKSEIASIEIVSNSGSDWCDIGLGYIGNALLNNNYISVDASVNESSESRSALIEFMFVMYDGEKTNVLSIEIVQDGCNEYVENDGEYGWTNKYYVLNMSLNVSGIRNPIVRLGRRLDTNALVIGICSEQNDALLNTSYIVYTYSNNSVVTARISVTDAFQNMTLITNTVRAYLTSLCEFSARDTFLTSLDICEWTFVGGFPINNGYRGDVDDLIKLPNSDGLYTL